MTKKQALQLYQERNVRTVWDDQEEKWYFSIVDVVSVLTDSENPQTYWRVLKNRLKKEGNETVTKCNALKLQASDGKMRLTDVADTEQLFRLIQSIPSPKAEPFKLWMAQVASQRIDQMQDPELSIDQAIVDYKRLGYGVKSHFPRDIVLFRGKMCNFAADLGRAGRPAPRHQASRRCAKPRGLMASSEGRKFSPGAYVPSQEVLPSIPRTYAPSHKVRHSCYKTYAPAMSDESLVRRVNVPSLES